MKYIRTKDAIYKTDYHNDERGYYITTDYYDFKDNEVKVAGTIEELCDEFVVDVPSDRKFNREFDLDNCKEYQLYLKGQSIVSEIYGAIYTDKGLIYVAKLNKKGELKLL